MADTKISNLTSGAPDQTGDALPIARSGANYKLTLADFFTADEHPTYSKFDDQSTVPSPPASGIQLFCFPQGGRRLPFFQGPSGIESAVNPAFFANNVTMWMCGTGATAAINFGVNWTIGGTQTTPAIANTNFMTAMKRGVFTSGTSGGSIAGVLSAAAICWIGSAAGKGGFFFAARFGVTTFASDMKIFCGLTALSTALAGDPSAMANSCGVSKDAADTNWQCITVNATPSATKIDSTRAVQAGGTTDVFDFYMFCKPNGTTITFRFEDIASGTVYVSEQGQTNTLPANNVMLYAHCEALNTTSGAIAIFLNKLYIESDT